MVLHPACRVYQWHCIHLTQKKYQQLPPLVRTVVYSVEKTVYKYRLLLLFLYTIVDEGKTDPGLIHTRVATIPPAKPRFVLMNGSRAGEVNTVPSVDL